MSSRAKEKGVGVWDFKDKKAMHLEMKKNFGKHSCHEVQRQGDTEEFEQAELAKFSPVYLPHLVKIFCTYL